jgi:membrane fusion protein, copper/silver efflux system
VAVFLAAVAIGVVWQRSAVETPGNEAHQDDQMSEQGEAGMVMDADHMQMDHGATHEGMAMGPSVTIDPVLMERAFTLATVEEGPRARTIRTIATIDYAEPLVGDVTLKVDAWIQQLNVNYEGQPVKRGQQLFTVYSPSLVTGQQEFLISLDALASAIRQGDAQRIAQARQTVAAVRQHLQYWDVSDAQIEQIAKSKKMLEYVAFDSPFAGIVTRKAAFEGQFFRGGELLYRIADLSKVWAYVFVYPDQIHCVFEGQGAKLTLANLPNRTFDGRVTFIYPYLEPKTRTVRVRLEFDNPELLLKPGMFGDVTLAPHEMGTGVNVPAHAVLNTGERELVYVVRAGDDQFEARTVTTGMPLDGDMVEILGGLTAGETIVLSDFFLMDSESRLRTVNRMFEPAPDWIEKPQAAEGEPGKMKMSHEMGHDHEAHDMQDHNPSQPAQHTHHHEGADGPPE